MTETVFLTGVTGFMGRYLLYQLAEADWVGEICVLIRPKRDVDPETRFKEVLKDPLILKAMDQGVSFDNVRVISGDIRMDNLGMSPEDIKYISSNVSFVIHNAAALSFATSLQEGLRNNTKPTWELYSMCCNVFEKKPAFILISTIATNSHLDLVPERVTDFTMKARHIYNYVSNAPPLDDNLSDFLKEGRLDGYGFSKGIAERMIFEHIEETGGSVPVHFVRPGGIICANEGPLPGWIHDTCFYAQLGYFIYKGQIPFFMADRTVDINMAPVDLIGNLTMACCREGLEKREKKDYSVQVVNGSKTCVAGMTFDKILDTVHETYPKLHKFAQAECDKNNIPVKISESPPRHPFYIGSKIIFDILFSILVWFPLWLYSLIYDGTKQCNKYKKLANLIYKYVSVLRPYLVRPVNIENKYCDVLQKKYPEYDIDGTKIDTDDFCFRFVSGVAIHMVAPMEMRSKRIMGKKAKSIPTSVS